MVNDRSGYRTMTEIATDAIKDKILRGVYQPGLRLIPTQMEKDLQLGRVAIREALQVLAGKGLVQSKPNRGVVVAESLDLEEMRGVYEIRVFLEGKAFELAIMKISEEEIQNLERLNRTMANNTLNLNEYFELNRKFHMDLYKASGWHFICQLISQIHDRISVFRSMFPYDQKVIKKYVHQHNKIIETIKAKDIEPAKKIMTKHLREGYDHMMELSQEK